MTAYRFLLELKFGTLERPDCISNERWKAMCKTIENAWKAFNGDFDCPACKDELTNYCKACHGRGTVL